MSGPAARAAALERQVLRCVVRRLIQGVVDAFVANGDVAEEDAPSLYDEIAQNSDVEGDRGPFVPSVAAYRWSTKE